MRLLGFILSLTLLAGTWANAQDIPAHSIPIGKGPGVAGFGVGGPCSTNQILAWAGGTGADPSCVNQGGGGGGTPGGANLNVQYNNGGLFGGLTDVQLTARIQAATTALSGAVPAWPNNTTTFFRGDGTYAALPACPTATTIALGCVEPDGTTITVTVGGVISAAASPLTINTSTISGGTPNGLLYDNAGTVGNLATIASGVLVTSAGSVPSISGTLPFTVPAHHWRNRRNHFHCQSPLDRQRCFCARTGHPFR